jgi:uronate dehydrogenase
VPQASTPPFERLLLTGASGGLGKVLRPALRDLCTTLRISDLHAPADPLASEEAVACDVGDRDAMMNLVRGVDAIAHFGGQSIESTFDTICHANIQGAFNLYEAARKHGVKRIVYASSSQVTGFYPTDVVVDPSMPVRPSSLYGLSKAFGENLSRLFYDRYGHRDGVPAHRDGVSEPTTHRMLRSYLSYRDLIELVKRGLLAKDAGHTIVYGVSANRDTLWRNPDGGEDRLGAARHLRAVPRRGRGAPARARPERRAEPLPRRQVHAGRAVRGSPRVTNTPALEVVAPTRNAVGESPLWHAGEGAVYWTDIPAKAVYRLDCVERRSHALRRGRDGRLPRARRRRRADRGDAPRRRAARHRRRPGDARPVDDVAYPRDGMRANDGRCDRQGRFWFGTMLMDMAAAQPVGGLYCHTGARGLDGPRIDGLIVQNGLAFSPDGRTMYLSDSHASVRRVWAFDFDPDDGAMSNRRPFVDMNAYPGRPDGAAVDAEGAYWTCGNDGGCIHRFAPDGKRIASYTLPVSKPSMASFGGPDLDWLFVTSIRRRRRATPTSRWPAACSPFARALTACPKRRTLRTDKEEKGADPRRCRQLQPACAPVPTSC